jgi:hypothetical protein
MDWVPLLDRVSTSVYLLFEFFMLSGRYSFSSSGIICVLDVKYLLGALWTVKKVLLILDEWSSPAILTEFVVD